MKKLISTLVLTIALIMANNVNAQSSQIATLSHDGTVSIFTGSSALSDAHSAATDGDVITLSAGTFSGTTITKAVTVRGAGMFAEENGTIISGSLIIKNTKNKETNIEGLFIAKLIIQDIPQGSSFSKCQITNVYHERGSSGLYSSLFDISFLNCFINGNFTLYSDGYCSGSIKFVNSVISNPLLSSGSNSAYSFINCYVSGVCELGGITASYYTIKNSIVILKSGYKLTGSPSQILYSRIYNAGSDLSNYGTKSSTHSGMPDLKDAERYILSDDLAKVALGSDGTQMGIYGGMLPFDSTPSNPQITKFNVASKTSADGKLSVEIEVKSAE